MINPIKFVMGFIAGLELKASPRVKTEMAAAQKDSESVDLETAIELIKNNNDRRNFS